MSENPATVSKMIFQLLYSNNRGEALEFFRGRTRRDERFAVYDFQRVLNEAFPPVVVAPDDPPNIIRGGPLLMVVPIGEVRMSRDLTPILRNYRIFSDRFWIGEAASRKPRDEMDDFLDSSMHKAFDELSEGEQRFLNVIVNTYNKWARQQNTLRVVSAA